MTADTDIDAPTTRSRSGLVNLVRAVPIRWRILSIAALNSAVVLILAAMIWNGARTLSSAWDEVRQVRESDRILATNPLPVARSHAAASRCDGRARTLRSNAARVAVLRSR